MNGGMIAAIVILAVIAAAALTALAAVLYLRHRERASANYVLDDCPKLNVALSPPICCLLIKMDPCPLFSSCAVFGEDKSSRISLVE